MKKPAAFISYARRDDAAYGRRITGLRQRLQRLIAAAIGRDFEIFQDCEGIAWGQQWRPRLHEALEEALFLIPILTPSYFNSAPCREELQSFLQLERESGRRDRILSLYFLDAPVYDQGTDPLAAALRQRQHRDWRHLRIDPVWSVKVMRALDSLAGELAATIHGRQEHATPPFAGSNLIPAPPPPGIRSTPRSEPMAATPPRPTVPNVSRSLPGTVFRDIDAPWCPELVVVPPGSFLMGSTEAERQWAVALGAASEWVKCEQPQHLVRIDHLLAVGRYPVTFHEYDHFAQAAGREPLHDEGWGRGRRPLINVSWHDAKAYIEWLVAETGHPYRLLSEAEWEYACRAGTSTRHWWGDESTPERANYGSSVGRTSEVGGYAANPWSLYDMNGNVWEWTEDCWSENYSGAPDDGRARTRGDRSLRVIRGASWKSKPGIVRAAYRNRHKSVDRENNIGFRVVKTLAP